MQTHEATFSPINFMQALNFLSTNPSDAMDTAAQRAVEVAWSLGLLGMRARHKGIVLPGAAFFAQVLCHAAVDLLRQSGRYDFFPEQPRMVQCGFTGEPSGSMTGAPLSFDKAVAMANGFLDEADETYCALAAEYPMLQENDTAVSGDLTRWTAKGGTDLSAALELIWAELDRETDTGSVQFLVITDEDLPPEQLAEALAQARRTLN